MPKYGMDTQTQHEYGREPATWILHIKSNVSDTIQLPILKCPCMIGWRDLDRVLGSAKGCMTTLNTGPSEIAITEFHMKTMI